MLKYREVFCSGRVEEFCEIATETILAGEKIIYKGLTSMGHHSSRLYLNGLWILQREID